MKQLLRLATCLIVLLLVVSCQSGEEEAAETTPAGSETEVTEISATAEVEPTAASVPETAEHPWWNDAVFYEVFVRSFYDSDGDGVGDLNGLIEKLDYLNDGDPNTEEDLGVTGIWLMPIMESPSYHGYDVVDYYSVDQEYGTNEDFRRLMEEAHARGIRVIVDLVLNHTSVAHPWFEASRDPNNERRDWYIWTEDAPDYPGPWGQDVWHETGDGAYYGIFWEGMPDLNYANPDVTAEMLAVTRFWLEEMGADGFRLDAIKHLIEDGEVQENTAETHEWMEEFFVVYKEANPEAVAVGEVWSATTEVVKYIGDEVDVAFEFDMALAILDSVDTGRRDSIGQAQTKVVASYPAGQYGVFITNHDQNRVMSELGNDAAKAKLAATLLLTSPGVPFIYYGEEIGMRGIKPDEDIRRPMQWSGAAGAGFTTGEPWRPPHQTYSDFNVVEQAADPESLLNHYDALIQVRNDYAALRTGEWRQVEAPGHDIYAFLRYTNNEVILVLLNLGDEAISDYGLDLSNGPLAGSAGATLLFGEGEVVAPVVNGNGGFDGYRPVETLRPQSSFIIRLGP
jgi:glycosidase